MKIGDICSREIVMTDQNATLQEAARLMRERHVGALLVVAATPEGTQAVGMVSDRDLAIEAVARALDATAIPVGRLAEGKLAGVPASATIDDAIGVMQARGVRRLVVSDGNGRLQGVVSLDDVVDALAQDMSALSQALHHGIEREAAEREPLEPEPPRLVHIPAFAFA